MTPWTDAEINRFQLREGMFKRRGLSDSQAGRIADSLAARDQEGDGRRMCIECKHLQLDGGCFAAAQGWLANTDKKFSPVKTVLQRCEGFEWAIPKTTKEYA